jgi:hypothetical protein
LQDKMDPRLGVTRLNILKLETERFNTETVGIKRTLSGRLNTEYISGLNVQYLYGVCHD